MQMNFDYTGKTVLVTGGSAGIGFACAELFGQLGAAVAICGTSEGKLRQAVEKLENQGIHAYGQVCNVGDAEQLNDFVDRAQAALGPISVLISNAGVYPQYDIIDTPEEIWDQTMEVNLKATYHCAKIAYRCMKENGGVLLLASSFASVFPSVGSGAYAASKSAVSSMVKTLAAELAPYNIRVNGYIPGVILTGMTTPLTAVNGEAMASAIALHRFGEPVDVAYAAAFLASEYAGYITGATLEITGGKMGVQNPAKAWADRETRA